MEQLDYREQVVSPNRPELLGDWACFGIMAVTENRIISAVNPEAERLLKIPSADLLGKPLDVLPDALCESLDGIFASQNTFTECTVLLQNEDGSLSNLR